MARAAEPVTSRRPARDASRALRALRAMLVPVLLLALGGCFWKYGFAGGGLPAHVRTVAIIPLDNQTPAPELTRELTEALRVGLENRLGLRTATEEKADAVVRGTIVRYEPDAPVAFSSDPTRSTQVRRRVQIVVDIEIFDQVSGKVLWSKKGLTAEGEYSDRGDATGRQQAIDRIVADVIEGAQSQW